MEFGESVRSYKIIQKALHLERPKHVNLIDVYIRYQLRLINLTEFVTKKKKMGKKYFCMCRYFLLFLIIIYYVNKVFRKFLHQTSKTIHFEHHTQKTSKIFKLGGNSFYLTFSARSL